MARDIAKILGANVRREGYYEGNGYAVTWALGHLCELKEPHDYTPMWKHWSLSALPMFPHRFGIKLKAEPHATKQFNVIKSLVNEADGIVNCGDAGQEGELIQRWIMQLCEVKCPVKRLWTSSLTDEAIRKGFRELRPQAEYDNLYMAGLSRAVGDWVLGMNVTRLYTVKYSSGWGKVLSLGRVQTPTLAMIVERHMAIRDFVPETIYELHSFYRGANFVSDGQRYSAKAEAQSAVRQLAGKQMRIDKIAHKSGREAPPRLFDLTSLQVECNKRWGWTADHSLQIIQSLYEKKVTTYPRVDNTYLPDEMYAVVPGILKKMTPYALQTKPLLSGKLPKSKKVFDTSKVTDHHAIIPTGESPSILQGDERLMYHLIALRFIAAFYPDCRFDTITVQSHIEELPFHANGKKVIEPGWRCLYNRDKERKSNELQTSGNNLAEAADEEKDVGVPISELDPPVTEGEMGEQTPTIVERTSHPPKPYTDATLLRAMETAGRNVDDEDLREAMKENGIGRPSTRAAIIETLMRRKYIERRKKNIVPTQAGMDLISLVNEPLLRSPKLTGIWESRLRRIERGSYSSAQFVTELKDMVRKIVNDVICDDSCASISVANDTPKKPVVASSKKLMK